MKDQIMSQSFIPALCRREETVKANRRLLIDKIQKELRMGVGDVTIMDKYGLSPRELIVIKREFLNVTPDRPVERQSGLVDDITVPVFAERRALQRREPLFKITVPDEGNPRSQGIIRDMHMKGLQIVNILGLNCTVLLEKHQISFTTLDTFLEKLVESERLKPEEVDDVLSWSLED